MGKQKSRSGPQSQRYKLHKPRQLQLEFKPRGAWAPASSPARQAFGHRGQRVFTGTHVTAVAGQARPRATHATPLAPLRPWDGDLGHGARSGSGGGGGLPGRFLKRNHVSCLKRPSVSKGVGLGVPLPHFLTCLQSPQSPGGREVSHGAHGLLASVTPEADPSRNGAPFVLEKGE